MSKKGNISFVQNDRSTERLALLALKRIFDPCRDRTNAVPRSVTTSYNRLMNDVTSIHVIMSQQFFLKKDIAFTECLLILEMMFF